MSPYIVFYFSLLSFKLFFFIHWVKNFSKSLPSNGLLFHSQEETFCHPTYWNWFARPHIHIYIFLCIFIDIRQSDCLSVFRLLVVIIHSTQNLLKKCLQTWYLSVTVAKHSNSDMLVLWIDVWFYHLNAVNVLTVTLLLNIGKQKLVFLHRYQNIIVQSLTELRDTLFYYSKNASGVMCNTKQEQQQNEAYKQASYLS